MKRIGHYLGISLQTELLTFTIMGIIYATFDRSFLEFNANLHKIWDIPMDPARFSHFAQLYMKYLLSGIILVHVCTIHLHLGCYVLLLCPIIIEEHPSLCLPWLVVSLIKLAITGVISLCAGLYTCLCYKFAKPACWDYIITHIVEHGPSIYMIILVFGFYANLKKIARLSQYINPVELKSPRTLIGASQEESEINELSKKRSFRPSVEVEHALYRISVNLKRRTSRSLDTLLTEITQLRDYPEDDSITLLMDPDSGLSLHERSTRLLKLTEPEVRAAKRKRTADELQMVRRKLQQLQEEEELERSRESLGGRESKVEHVTDYSDINEDCSGINEDCNSDTNEAKEEQCVECVMQDTCLQADPPELEQIVAEIATRSNLGLVSTRRKSTLTEPSQIREALSPCMSLSPKMEGSCFNDPQLSSSTMKLKQKNSQYKDDGYTQALIETSQQVNTGAQLV